MHYSRRSTQSHPAHSQSLISTHTTNRHRVLTAHHTMSAPSIILVGAGGYLGKPVTQELLANRSRFDRIAILTQESKRAKFAEHEASGFELVLGALDSPDSFRGTACHTLLPHKLANWVQVSILLSVCSVTTLWNSNPPSSTPPSLLA
jgi:hypothetical protein